MRDSLRGKTIRGAAWTTVERFSSQAVGFVVSVILARLLTPADYGILGMLSVFIGFSQLFIDSGFTSALIQKKNRTDIDFSTVFWSNFAISLACYSILFVASPLIADYYKMPELKLMMRVLGLSLIVNATYTVQVTRLTAMLDFKTQAKVTLVNCVVSGVVGITLAVFGFGAWALIGQVLFTGLFASVAYASISGWRPGFCFSVDSFKGLFSFGSRILGASVLSVLYSNVAPLIIGRKYHAATLGQYTRANTLAALPGSVFQSTLGRVIFPVLSTIQDDDARLLLVYRRYSDVVMGVVFAAMFLLAAVSNPLVMTLFGAKWMPCAPYISLLAVAWSLDPLVVMSLNLIYVKGRSDIVLKLEIVKKLFAITLIVVAVQHGIVWLCMARILTGMVELALNWLACRRILKLSILQQLKSANVIVLTASVSALTAYAVSWVLARVMMGNAWAIALINLVVSSLVGVGLYCCLVKMCSLPFADDVVRTLKEIVSRMRSSGR